MAKRSVRGVPVPRGGIALHRAAIALLLVTSSVTAPAVARGNGEGNQTSDNNDGRVSGFFDAILEDVDHVTYAPDVGYINTLQKRIPKSTPHPCDMKEDKPMPWRSETPPESVDKLRPGDIDIVGAIGDSIVSGNGARETDVLGMFIDDRGVSFLGGGQGTWREFTKLPNIIKVFNPKLVGFATGRGLITGGDGELNLAGAGTRDAHLLIMAKMFVHKLRTERTYNMKNHWKLLNVLTGHNNICTFECYEKEKHSPEAHKKHLQVALDYLYENVPRLFVNVIPIIDPTINPRATSGLICSITRRIGCRCLYTEPTFEEGVAKLSSIARKFQEAERELVLSDRYSGKEDFTVEWQPFIRSLNAPVNGDPENAKMLKLLKTNERIWTYDCFHFNQRGHMTMSIHLWNNMMEPQGNKSETFERFLVDDYKCPTKDHPYFFTKRNSETFAKVGHQ